MKEILTKEESGFVKDIIANGNATKAVLDNFSKVKDPNYAGVKGYKLIRKDKIQRKIKSIAESIPDKLLIEKHLELLTVPRKVRTYVKGDLKEESEEIDANAIGKGLDMAYKIKGAYAPEKVNHTGEVKITAFRGFDNDEQKLNGNTNERIQG